jgi:hypothetical protein
LDDVGDDALIDAVSWKQQDIIVLVVEKKKKKERNACIFRFAIADAMVDLTLAGFASSKA